jgi:hypothetical protein
MFSTGIGFGDYAARTDGHKLFLSLLSLWCVSLLAAFLRVTVDEMLWRAQHQIDSQMLHRHDEMLDLIQNGASTGTTPLKSEEGDGAY